MPEYTPYQQGIIRRYYDNRGAILYQQLSELVSELYLAEAKKKDRVWKRVATALQKLGVAQSRIDHLLAKADPALLAEVLKELDQPMR